MDDAYLVISINGSGSNECGYIFIRCALTRKYFYQLAGLSFTVVNMRLWAFQDVNRK